MRLILGSMIVVLALGLVTHTYGTNDDAIVDIPNGTGLCTEDGADCYSPATITVSKGTTVTWTNSDSTTPIHTITSGRINDRNNVGAVFNSEFIVQGDTFAHTFNEAGEHPYFCMLHPLMAGVVVVEGDPGESGSTDPIMNPVNIILDQQVYTWTDKVYITIVAPNYNVDSDLIDEIGGTNENSIRIHTQMGGAIDNYRLVETGPNTGIFGGEVTLTGFTYNADGYVNTGIGGNDLITSETSGRGPIDGLLPAGDKDSINIAFEFIDNKSLLTSAIIRWNLGDVQWEEPIYPITNSAVIRVIDPDMNLNSEAIDGLNVHIYSDSDSGGIILEATETQISSGIFETTVRFTTDNTSGNRLRVAEGDTVIARYADHTLPNPHMRNDKLDITGTTLISTKVPPLERAVVSNVRLIDTSGNTVERAIVGQQIQITGQITSGQVFDQEYTYLVQINDVNDATILLTWTNGVLNAGQSDSTWITWQPEVAGEYSATVFIKILSEGADRLQLMDLSPQQNITFEVVGSTLNVGIIQWIEFEYSTSDTSFGSAIVRVVDNDMNMNSSETDSFNVNISSDSDSTGITLLVTETQTSSGIFEGTVHFTTEDISSASRLRANEGDVVVARYIDNTLPAPYGSDEEITIEGTDMIRNAPTSSLERVLLSNVALTDTFGNALEQATIDQLISITGQVTSSVDGEQDYAYLVQISDSSDATLFLTWTSGTLYKDQSITSAVSWAPTARGSYTAVIFVWESITNPVALSPPVVLPFTVN